MSIDPLKIIWQINLMEVKMLLKYLRKDIELVLNKQFFREMIMRSNFRRSRNCQKSHFQGGQMYQKYMLILVKKPRESINFFKSLF
jgi:hypothetical protein